MGRGGFEPTSDMLGASRLRVTDEIRKVFDFAHRRLAGEAGVLPLRPHGDANTAWTGGHGLDYDRDHP